MVTAGNILASAPRERQVRRPQTRHAAQQQQRIPGVFLLLLALYLLLAGPAPAVLQSVAYGVQGGVADEFAVAMITATAHDLLLLVAVIALAKHPLGILHPLLLAVILWPIVIGLPEVIQDYGGWAGVLAGLPVQAPYFQGMPGRSPSTVWIAIAKFNALETISLISTYFGFWLWKSKQSGLLAVFLPKPTALRSVLLALVAFSFFVLLAFVWFRGGLSAHMTSLGHGRFRELAGDGPIIALTDFGAIALYIWIAARPSDVKTPLFLLCLGLETAVQFISNGSRGSALSVPLVAGLVWAIRTQRVPWRIALLLIPLLFASLGLMNAIRTSSWSGQTAGEALASSSWVQSFARAQEEVVARQALAAPVPIIERGREVSNGLLFGKSYGAAFTSFIPRFIWEDKPRGPGSLYAQLFLGAPREGLGIPVGATAEMFWNFGLVGVILLSMMYGALLSAEYSFFRRRYPDPFSLVFYVIFLTMFDFSTKKLVDFQQAVVLIFICWVLVQMLVPFTLFRRSTFTLAPTQTNARLGTRRTKRFS